MAWHSRKLDGAGCICEAEGVEVILGDWSSEDEHRQAGLSALKKRGFQHVLIPDGDEVIEPQLLDHLIRFAEADLADRIYIEWDTFWKTLDFVVRTREVMRGFWVEG